MLIILASILKNNNNKKKTDWILDVVQISKSPTIQPVFILISRKIIPKLIRQNPVKRSDEYNNNTQNHRGEETNNNNTQNHRGDRNKSLRIC